jgi:DNA gyrase subunit B
MLKEKDDRVTGDDIREGLTAIISVKLPSRSSRARPRPSSGNTEAKTFVQKRGERPSSVTGSRSNPNEGKEIVRKAVSQAASARMAARKAREARGARACSEVRPARQAASTARPPTRGVRAVHRRGRLGRRLGASGSRPGDQAILPIRGKILNVEKARIDRVLANNEVRRSSALGTGVRTSSTSTSCATTRSS